MASDATKSITLRFFFDPLSPYVFSDLRYLCPSKATFSFGHGPKLRLATYDYLNL